MGLQLVVNAVNQAEAGNCILSRGENVNYICMVLKGKVVAKGKGIYHPLGAGSFLGISDFYAGQYQCDYEALENVSFFAFPASETKGLKHILSANRDYGGLMVWAFAKQIAEQGRVLNEICDTAKNLSDAVQEYYKKYLEFGENAGLKPRRLTFVEETCIL